MKTIYLFIENDNNNIPIRPMNYDDILDNIELFNIYGCQYCPYSYGHFHFNSNINNDRLIDFVDSLKHTFNKRLYFAKRKNGNIFII